MSSAAPTLPAGFTGSAWPDLDPTSRALLLAEFLVVNPHLELRGGVDYEASLEPVVFDVVTGDRISLSGETISSGSGGLVVPIFDGQLASAGGLWAVAFVGLAVLVFINSKS